MEKMRQVTVLILQMEILMRNILLRYMVDKQSIRMGILLL